MLSSWIFQLDKRLAGAPDTLLTVALLTVAAVLIGIALTGRPAAKATALAWVVAP